MSFADSIKVITGEFSRIFRHLVPGVIIVGLLYWSHPSWFTWVTPLDKSLYWIILAVFSIVIGNLWYVIHRFTIHNLIDWVCYRCRIGTWNKYPLWLSNHIQLSFTPTKDKEELKKFVYFRSSQVILLFIFAEALILFSFWHENSGVFQEYQWIFLGFGSGVFLAGLVQFWIGFNLDVDVVTSQGMDRQDAQKSTAPVAAEPRR